jgi:hypothetical protein
MSQVATCRRLAIGPLRLRLYRTPEIGTRLVGAFVTRADNPEAREETALGVDFHSDHLARMRAEQDASLPTATDASGSEHRGLAGHWGGVAYTIPAAKLAAIADHDARNAELIRLRKAEVLD